MLDGGLSGRPFLAHGSDPIELGETVGLPDGGDATVIDVYDDEEHGREGGVNATLAVDVD